MICPKCKAKAQVTHTKSSDVKMETTRYHTCEKCSYKFTTIERLPGGWNYELRYQKLINSMKKLIQDFE